MREEHGRRYCADASRITNHLNNVRVADAKEVGVGNPVEETFRHPDERILAKTLPAVKTAGSYLFVRAGKIRLNSASDAHGPFA